MMMELGNKVTAVHLKRTAYLYVRQSTLRQVVEHTESTKRQYALKQRAVQLGWRARAGHCDRQRSRRVRRIDGGSRRLPEAGGRSQHGTRRHRARP